MNRHWQAFFADGIVRTTEDFGTQGADPTHPLLLDWLATEFVAGGWDIKRMHRLFVTSATYRQSSPVTAQHLRVDPENELLSRMPRFRVEAELVRDVALSASGLLTRRIGGPSVFPPQPAGVTELSFGTLAWNTSPGADRYRRGLYTFMKRTTPYAAFLLFDAPSGETCTVRRTSSNTPLQALTLLNDAVFVDAAQALARRAVHEAPSEPARALDFMFRCCLVRPPSEAEAADLLAFYRQQRERFATGGADADAVLASVPAAAAADADPAHPCEPTVPAEDLAAFTTVARVLLNLDETVTRE
jgi:hypothetical protein